jgi:hypothetical protein
MLASMLVFLLGCRLFDGAIALIDDQETKDNLIGLALDVITEGRKANEPRPEVVDEELKPNSAQEYAWQMGDRCINAPGTDPCPLEACMVASDQYTVKFDTPVELFGKANPDNYSCGADYQFTNNSGTNLVVWHNVLSSDDNLIAVNVVKIETDSIFEEYHMNYFDRHDGRVTFRTIPEIYVLYDNPHCDWIEYVDPELEQYAVTLMNPCEK